MDGLLETAADLAGDHCLFGCQETQGPVAQKLSSSDSGFEADSEFYAARH